MGRNLLKSGYLPRRCIWRIGAAALVLAVGAGSLYLVV
jgi:hypothetical protein